ncbi:MAG: copper chaperone PCu(A)C [Stenotrophobium sp.]
MHVKTLMSTLSAVTLLFIATGAMAAGKPEFRDGWIRLLPASLPAAGYFTLSNTGDSALTLTGARSTDYGSVMMHQSMTDSEGAHMRMVDAVAINPGETLRFKPGSYHLMLMDARSKIEVGEKVPIQLMFADGHSLDAEFTVRPAAASGP